MSWIIDINEINDNLFKIMLKLNGLQFIAKISVEDIQTFCKTKQLMILNKNHNMHLHIISGNVSAIQYVNSNNLNDDNDFTFRFDGIDGDQIYEYVKNFWNKYQKEKFNEDLSKYTLEKVLIEWCDENLTNNRAYGSSTHKFKLDENIHGKLIYQDGTGCSASHAFSCIYKLYDETYVVLTDCSISNFHGDAHGTNTLIKKNCKNIMEVLDHLVEFSFHDANSTGDLLKNIIHNYQLKLDKDMVKNKIPILSKCNQDDINLIKAIKSHMNNWRMDYWN